VLLGVLQLAEAVRKDVLVQVFLQQFANDALNLGWAATAAVSLPIGTTRRMTTMTVSKTSD